MSDAKSVMERKDAAFNARDAEGMGWSADAEMACPVAQLRGRDEILGFVTGFWAAFPDARLQPVRMIGEGSLAAAEGTFTGTHTGVLRTPDGDVAPTGLRLEFRWMSMVEARGDEVLSEHLYWDQLEFLTQLGLAPTSLSQPTSEP